MGLLVCRRAAVLALALGCVPAQDLPREPGFGRVLDKDGVPWVGAKVFLEHRSHPLVQDPACMDLIEATTDERGQFRVDMLPASGYAVWARSAVGEDGPCIVCSKQKAAYDNISVTDV